MSITGIDPRRGLSRAQAQALIDTETAGDVAALIDAEETARNAAIAAALVPFPDNALPAWETGRYYDISSSGLPSGFGATTLQANVIHYVPLWVPYNVTIDRLAIYVSVASGTGGATARLALFSKHATLWRPGALLLDSGTIGLAAIDATGLKTITVSQALLGGRWYWTAVNASAAGASILGFTGGPAYRGRSDLSIAPEWGTQEALAYGAMPANATPLAGGISLRVVSVRAA